MRLLRRGEQLRQIVPRRIVGHVAARQVERRLHFAQRRAECLTAVRQVFALLRRGDAIHRGLQRCGVRVKPFAVLVDELHAVVVLRGAGHIAGDPLGHRGAELFVERTDGGGVVHLDVGNGACLRAVAFTQLGVGGALVFESAHRLFALRAVERDLLFAALVGDHDADHDQREDREHSERPEDHAHIHRMIVLVVRFAWGRLLCHGRDFIGIDQLGLRTRFGRCVQDCAIVKHEPSLLLLRSFSGARPDTGPWARSTPVYAVGVLSVHNPSCVVIRAYA